MPDTLHIVIHQEPAGRTGGRRTGTAARGLRDPEHETTLPDPDDPEHETTLPDPDDPEHETTLPDPDDPRGRWATVALEGGAPWSPGSAAAPGQGCVPVCGCHVGGEHDARPEMLPRDYSGFVILRLAAGVEIGGLEHLWDIAAENGLSGLAAVLDLETEWREVGGAGAGETGADEDGEIGAAGARAAGSSLSFFGRSEPRDKARGGQGGKGGTDRPRVGGGGRYADGEPTGRDRDDDTGDGDTGDGEKDHDGEGGSGDNGEGGVTDGSPPEPRPPGLRSWPLIAGHGRQTRGEVVDALHGLEARAAKTRLAPRHSLTRYWRIDLRPYPERAAEVVDKLRALAEVDLAYRELAASDPQYGSPPAGESLAEGQGYLDDAPAGIGARWAWQQIALRRQQGPASVDPVRVCDVEQRWEPRHQDLPPLALHYGENRDAAGEEAGGGHHGTAVLGQLAAASSGAGVAGGAQPVGSFSLSSHYRSKRAPVHTFPGTNGHVAAAIVFTLLDGGDADELERGDVLLLEVQRAGLPTEVDAADFDAVRLAAALGVVVVEAAGNGGRDLDAYVDPDTGYELRRGAAGFRDSGAILVGAARSALPHDRASFSNHGSRVDCFAWGDSVTSCGYGDLAGAASTDYYTNTFSGTSSASPIIAAAAALVQALHPGRLDSRQMRALLSKPATGTLQGPDVAGHVGVMPDLRRLVCDELRLVPDVYLRRWLGDDGRRPRRDDPAASSPDVMVLPKGREGGVWRGAGAHHPSPGGGAEPGGGDYEVWTRLRNRGTGEGRVEVRVFHSPAATLIPPELWHPVAQGSSLWVGQGDVPFEPDALPFEPPAADLGGWSPPPYSFLVVARPLPPAPDQGQPAPFPAPVDRTGGLPPGGEWFDWAEYRAFLRRSGVAWRNVHTVGPAAMRAMPFFLAGTPDRERRFTFEVIQRLPAGASVSLDVPGALAARLVQAQPLLTRKGAALELPGRPLLAVPGVALPAGLRARATFAVRLGHPSPPGEGYSLALRQLWRGEEVGRITWYLRAAEAAGERQPEAENRSTA
jgi:serine protease